MKKKVISLLLILALCISLVPTITTHANAVKYVRPSDKFIQNRINELCEWRCGKYFNVGENTACGSSTGHGCENCRISNIVQASWFKEHFPHQKITASQFGGIMGDQQSCVGFAWFAGWYIMRASDSDSVTRVRIGEYTSNTKNAIKTKAKIGDYLWINGHHAVIYLGYSSEGIQVLDSNYYRNSNCRVEKHSNWTWSSIKSVRIDRFYSNSGHYCTPDQNGSTLYKTVKKADSSYAAICKKCGYEYQLGELDTSTRGIYTANATVQGCSAPYQDSGYFCYVKGAKITVVGSTKNAYGNVWYKTASGDWIYSKNVSKTSSLKSTLSISGETYPTGTLSKGKSFALSGIISSNYKIKTVKAYVYNEAGKAVLTYSKSMNSTSYNIKSGGLNSAMSFGKLPAGTYTYVVEAKDASGLNITLIKSHFIVK